MSRIVLIALVATVFLLSSVVEETNAQWGWGWPYGYGYGWGGYGWPYYNNYMWWGKRAAGFGPSETDAALQGSQSAGAQ